MIKHTLGDHTYTHTQIKDKISLKMNENPRKWQNSGESWKVDGDRTLRKKNCHWLLCGSTNYKLRAASLLCYRKAGTQLENSVTGLKDQ